MWAIIIGVIAAILILFLIGGCAYCETRPSSALYQLEARLNGGSSSLKGARMHGSSLNKNTDVPKSGF
jgi:hypothetical protein